jgi:hypothetical protein
VTGNRVAGAAETARGFVGVVFPEVRDGPPFETFYLRRFNEPSDDPLQRNHSAQYIPSSEFPWN